MLTSCVGVVVLKTSKGEEYFLPLLGLFVGDMMELLLAARNMSANFSRLSMPCPVCKKAGCHLSNLSPSDLRDMAENERLIAAAIAELRSGVRSHACHELAKHSLLPVEV